MSALHEDDHIWFRQLLGDYLLDLLDEQESAQIDTHARSCEPCGRLLAGARRMRADWWEGTGHPPVSVLAAYPLQGDAQASGQPEFVRRHIETCETCRGDLAALSGTVPAAATDAQPRQDDLPQPQPQPRSRGIVWASVGSVAAVLIVLMMARQQPAQPVVALAPPAAIAPAPVITQESAPIENSPPAGGDHTASPSMEPVAIAGAARGAALPVTSLSVPAGVTDVPLTLPALFIPDGATVVVELRRANGVVLSRERMTAEAASRPGGIKLKVFLLEPGPHTLRVGWLDATTGPESREYPLDILTAR